MRRIVRILAAAGLALVLAVAVMPWWLGGALRVFGAPYGLEFSEYHSIGYARWALTDVAWRGFQGKLAIQRVELPHPLWLLLQGSGSEPLRIEGWQWQSAANKEITKVTAENRGGWQDTFNLIQETMSWLPHRLPLTEMTQGTFMMGQRKVTLQYLAWDPDQASLRFTDLLVQNQLWSGQGSWSDENSQLVGHITSNEGSAQFTAHHEEIEFKGSWWKQPVVGRAEFDPIGWLPVHAELDASDWNLPGSRLGLEGQFEKVRGHARAIWQQNQFELSLMADGEPMPDREIPPLHVAVRAHGDVNSVVIEELEVTAPGLEAHLSKPIAMGQLMGQSSSAAPAEFTVQADLEALTREQGSGRISGTIDVSPVAGAWPQLQGRLLAESMRWKDWPNVSGQLEAGFDGKTLKVGSLKMSAADDSHFEASGDWIVSSRSVNNLELSGVITPRWVAPWMPEALDFSKVQFSGTVNGIWPNVVHQGTLVADDLVYGKVNTTNWKLVWEGDGRRINGKLEGEAGESQLTLEATAAETSLRITALTLQRADHAEMTLLKPAMLNWQSGLLLDGLFLQGPNEGLKVSLEKQGHWHLQMVRLEQTWWQDWVTLPGPDWFVENLLLDVQKIGEAWQGQAKTKVAVDMGENRSAQIELEMLLDAESLQIKQGAISEGELPILNVTGRIPLTLSPDYREDSWGFDLEKTLDLKISSKSNPVFWQQIHKTMGVEVRNPLVNGTLSGSWKEPAGEIDLGADLIRLNAERWGTHWPELREIKAHLRGTSEGLALDQLTARISGQEVRVSGLLPLDHKKHILLRDDPWTYLRQIGKGKVEITDADLSRWTTLAPGALAPSGRLRMALQIAPGGMIDGAMYLTGAALRPIGPLGALQDITAEVRFEGRRITIKSVEAQTGGRPVELKGEARWLESGRPQFDLSLRGKNLPLVRQTGLLLRGDVDLKLQTDDEGVNWVRGAVGLRDGLFLVDLESLRPSAGGGGSAGRPPYFSVTGKPFADWRLDVAVKGDNFLRMETPVFSGRASADFHLLGTLREPRAIGEAVVTEGLVKLPFATFNVSEGWVRLLQSNPHDLNISVIGNARRLDYDLRMELLGTASSPTLQFYSNPPLSSEEVLLMVMAGESPSQNMNYSSSQRAAKLGTYLGRNLINQFTGNRDSEERLMISLEEKVSEGGRETYRIEYYLNSRWSLIGEYDEFDDYNAGVKWKVFSSGKKQENDDDQ